MNKVIFNYYGMQACCNSKFHGASEYGKTVLKYLAENYSDKAEIAIIFNPICKIERWLDELLKEKKIKKLEIVSWDDVVQVVDDFQADIFYSPTRLSPKIMNKLIGKIRIKETLHDFRGIELIADIKMMKYMTILGKVKNIYKWLTKKYYRRHLITKAQLDIDIIDDIYCVSKHTYYSMCLLFSKLSQKKINVYYSPPKSLPQINDFSNPLGKDKYILMIGGDRWTKNPFRTALAIDRVLSMPECMQYKAVVIGNITKQLKRQLKNIDKFIFNDYVDTDVLERYYANCDVFIYASLNEGFGYPPVEAMRYGKTCIVSGTTSMPEVCGNAVYFVNPYDIHEISERLIMALNEKIDELVVKNQVDYINKLQLNSLKDMCQDIINYKRE